MKQLKYYPDINFPPRLQLLITAHSELGTTVENIFSQKYFESKFYWEIENFYENQKSKFLRKVSFLKLLKNINILAKKTKFWPNSFQLWLGTCSWCTDGNAKLLKFILREYLAYRNELIKRKDLADTHAQLNIVNAEISQAIYCLIQYPTKRPKGIVDHRSKSLKIESVMTPVF